jgi:hypothetical protein
VRGVLVLSALERSDYFTTADGRDPPQPWLWPLLHRAPERIIPHLISGSMMSRDNHRIPGIAFPLMPVRNLSPAGLGDRGEIDKVTHVVLHAGLPNHSK